ncbi:hypothetical protein [Pararobbsia alpina]|uniref:Uncharacterized protein n=1 Tax=Pararobbsia alpina TaxID=621374 RepID=A0A6S7C239_9BURK|nr:hypothetical protein [Pararobbsia alpina]CAB3799575.1 hypothetical protein LMG28138_04679 [Pararobbsia alpina]
MRPISFARAASIAALAGLFATAESAQKAPLPDGASMVKPPQSPASGVDAHNPDNMPIKRPEQPTNDPMSRPPPASGPTPK